MAENTPWQLQFPAQWIAANARDLFDYDTATGIVSRKKDGYRGYIRYNKAGKSIGRTADGTIRRRKTTRIDGYVFHVNVSGRRISPSAHIIAYFLIHGALPPIGTTIDHIDLNPLNNHPDNLRAATASEQGATKAA